MSPASSASGGRRRDGGRPAEPRPDEGSPRARALPGAAARAREPRARRARPDRRAARPGARGARHQDVELAQMVIADDDRVDGRYLEVHQGILSLLALQAPVAGDLRLVAALLHMIKHIERMGDQCVNIAKMIPLSGLRAAGPRRNARRRSPRWAPSPARRSIQCKAAFAGRDVAPGRGPRPPGPRNQPPEPRDLPPGDRNRRRPRHARVGHAHDARGPRAGADRRQRRRHRRAGRVRRHRAVPGVLRTPRARSGASQ